MNAPAWEVLRWKNRPAQIADALPFTCPDCGVAGAMPCAKLHGGAVSAVLPGNRMVLTPWNLNPPRNFLPDRVECPHCGQTFTLDEPIKEEA